MRLVWILLALAACAPVQNTVMAPPTEVILSHCESTRALGEGCSQTCECLSPLDCMNNICSLSHLSDGSPCEHNEQCIHRYCTQNKTCGGPEHSAVYDCERVCHDRYDASRTDCHTVCRYRD